jgi:hypothetical protein
VCGAGRGSAPAEADGDALVRPADPAYEPDARLAILEEAELQAVLPEDLSLGGLPQRDIGDRHSWLLPSQSWCQYGAKLRAIQRVMPRRVETLKLS